MRLLHHAHRWRLLASAVTITLASASAASSIPSTARTALATASSGVSLTVKNCEDDNSKDSLRSVLATATDGDTVDMSTLSCSSITLKQGQLPTSKAVTLLGPGTGLAIDGDHRSRVFSVTSTAKVSLSHLSIRNGTTSTTNGGGCIYAKGSLNLVDVDVHDCVAQPPLYVVAQGGAILAKNSVDMRESKVTHSTAIAQPGSRAEGGGVWAPSLFSKQSTISYNSAQSDLQNPSVGGAVYTSQESRITYSTMAHNRASRGGGAYSAYYGYFTESTFSYNSARTGGAAFISSRNNANHSYARLYLANSTVASNYADAAADVGGMYVNNGYMQVYSSIVANNVVTGNVKLASQDIVYGYPITIHGDRNIITTSSVGKLKNTITADPLLGPLQDNGGGVLTRLILSGSPAIKNGVDLGSSNFDERYFLRVSPMIDIGAVQDTIFVSTLDPVAVEGPQLLKPKPN